MDTLMLAISALVLNIIDSSLRALFASCNQWSRQCNTVGNSALACKCATLNGNEEQYMVGNSALACKCSNLNRNEEQCMANNAQELFNVVRM